MTKKFEKIKKTMQTPDGLDIKIGSLNINGSLSKKLDFEDVKKFIKTTDICTIQESWMLPGEQIQFPSYKHFKNIRKPKNKAKRGSGGMIILYKSELEKGITREKSKDEKHTIWLKCDKDFFNLQEHLYLANVYFPPQSSSYVDDSESILTKFEKDLSKFSNFGDICIIGDLNARISDFSEDFLTEDFISPQENNDPTENINKILNKRTSEDSKKNKRGKNLEKLINANKLVLLNGRKIGDTVGRFTCHEWNGSSVVDLCFCNHAFYNKISSFQILPHEWFSDHCPILITLKTNKTNKMTNSWDKTVTSPTPTKFVWNEQGAQLFCKNSESKEVKEALAALRQETNFKIIANNFEEIIANIAQKTLKKISNSNPKPTNQTQQWMKAELREESKDFKKARTSFLREKTLDRRQFYMNKKKKF